MLSNCGAGEDSWEPLGQQGDPISPFSRKSTLKTDAELEAPILWPPDVKSRLIGKDSDAGKDWGQEEKWVTEDEMVGWHHWLNGYEFEQTPGDSGGQGSLACCRSTGSLRVRHTLVTERQQSVTEVGLIDRPSISQAGSHPSIPQRSATQQMPKEFKRARTPCSVKD